MDGSKLSSDVVSDCCVWDRGVQEVVHSFGYLGLSDGSTAKSECSAVIDRVLTLGFDKDWFDEGIQKDVFHPVVDTVELYEEAWSHVEETLEKNQDGDTILHLNIIFMLTQPVFEIISKVPNRDCLNIQNNLMQTPLILAALTRQTNIVRRLMAAGADIDKRDRHGDTVLHVACRNGDLGMLKQITTPIGMDEMCMYHYEYPRCVQRIAPDLNAKNYDGLTPLHLATIEGHLEIMSELADLGADVDAQEGLSGKRALHLAVEFNNKLAIRQLVEHCAVDIDSTTFYNLSPVMLANDRRLYWVVEYLVQCGADRSELDCSEVDYESDTSNDISG